ncbi:calcium-transporting ATPase 12, plasma membrane-type-like [Hevea brasiliensis]|uniref:calcium-transporting ATPase 12, plasma membrane-type-like n=1 Tax=Hevea brasiliensis TaxID=3981 RepID=UPI0025F3F400|nr:calcium-transporting ATPase 12, plasma membrane-type-like [Hevea brasiliensis]
MEMEMVQHHSGGDLEEGIHYRGHGDAKDFAIDQESLVSLLEFDGFSHSQFQRIEEIAAALETSVSTGITGDPEDLNRRRDYFGSNHEDGLLEVAPTDTRKSLSRRTLECFKDPNVIMLLFSSALSLILGILKYGVKKGWCDGFIILIEAFITVLVKIYKERYLKVSINRQSLEETVHVMRDGSLQQVPISQVVVGDVLSLKTGDRVPADGLFISGSSSLKLNNAGSESFDMDSSRFQAIFAGATVVSGECRMLVISVGSNKRWSKMINSIGRGDKSVKAQLMTTVDNLSSRMEKLAILFPLVLLVVQLLCYLIRRSLTSSNNDDDKGLNNHGMNSTMDELMSQVTTLINRHAGIFSRFLAVTSVLLMAIREGLNLGVFICLSYSRRTLELECRVMVRDLVACAAVGLASTICTGETGDLSLKKMNVAELWIGGEMVSDAATIVSQEVLDVLHDGVGLNVYGPVEDAQICWVRLALGVDVGKLKQDSTVVETEAFDFDRACSCTSLTKKKEMIMGKSIVHKHLNGVPDDVLPFCRYYCEVNGTVKLIDEDQRAVFDSICQHIAADSTHCLAFAYQQVVVSEGEEQQLEDKKEISKFACYDGFILLGIVGFKNPYPLEMKEAVQACRDAGIGIKLVLNEDRNIGRFIAVNSGIISRGDLQKAVVEAAEFRSLSDEERERLIDHIQVMVNSTPVDKLLLAQCLRKKFDAVMVIGDNSMDFPSLKEADIGLLLGSVSENAICNENSDDEIVVMDRSFATVASILRRGRHAYSNMQKFVQLHLTAMIAAVAVNFVAGIPSGESLFSPLQVSWVSLIIVDTLGALALATDQPNQISSLPMPVIHGAGSSLLTRIMWKNIVFQVIYQVIIFIVLHFKGSEIFHVEHAVADAMIFNSYALCQIFVLLNAREIEKTNVLENLYKNSRFLLAVLAMVLLQFTFIEIFSYFSPAAKLGLQKWLVCVAISSLSLPIGFVVKFIQVSG